MTERKYALILTVENEDAINNNRPDIPFRYFEAESVKCIKAWRKNADWLKDIPIYVMNPTGDVKQETKDSYKDLDVTYISKEPSYFRFHEYGFWNVHYVGHYLETLPELQNTLLIHIDVDMDLIRPFPKNYFDSLWNKEYDAFLGGYFKDDYKSQRDPIYTEELTNTGFICNIAGHFNFYGRLLEQVDHVEMKYKELGNLRGYDKEEYCSDRLSTKFNIKVQNGYEQGEGYSKAKDLSNVFFWHQHLYENQNIKLGIERFKLEKELNEKFGVQE